MKKLDTAVTITDAAIAAAVIAHDNEENAQRGEPQAWTEVPVLDPSGEWSDRMFCMRLAIETFLAASLPSTGAPREAFLDMIADAKTFHTETDGDETGVHTQHTIVTDDGQLAALVAALGIEKRWGEPTEDAIGRAINGDESNA